MSLPNDLFAQIKKKQQVVSEDEDTPKPKANQNAMLAQLMAAKQSKQQPKHGTDSTSNPTSSAAVTTETNSKTTTTTTKSNGSYEFHGKPYLYDESIESFIFAAHHTKLTDSTQQERLTTPCLVKSDDNNSTPNSIIISIPLAPCVYRMTDYTYAKKEPIAISRCILKLGVLRCLQRECIVINELLTNRYSTSVNATYYGPMEEDEIGKLRFMELLSNCGIYQKVTELLLKQIGTSIDTITQPNNIGKVDGSSCVHVPQIVVDGLDDFLQTVETLNPSLENARNEIIITQTVSFYPGLGELFTPGSKLTCFPEGMDGTPLGCQVVQCWYDEEINKATQKLKRRFILVIEFIVSVGDELVFVAASDVYPEFHDPNRNTPIKDLTHRKLLPDTNPDDALLLQKLQLRGEFYASVATKNHYLEYHPNSFFPIIGGGWNSNAIRPLSKGGRVMVDVKRGILEGHVPVRSGTTGVDGMSDTVKEAIKLFEQSKRTGVAVPFRTCILPGFDSAHPEGKEDTSTTTAVAASDRNHLWQAWPMLTGFSFTARVWGKLLLAMPRNVPAPVVVPSPKGPPLVGRGALGDPDVEQIVSRPSVRKFGGTVVVGALGGVGKCGNCGYIKFHEQAFEQLVLDDDKKELIRAVARNAGGGDDNYDDDDDDDDDIGIDVVANKGGASIFLLHGPPGTGKTLTAEAIAELLRKPLYVVTAGDLGITASEVEKTLGSVLELCQTWDALVLIDEADIFLEARNSHEIQRNALVCVMLRLLEYYSGCLFLSSNRSASSIDAAIASRITVMLSYPPLDISGRTKIWKNLIELIPLIPASLQGTDIGTGSGSRKQRKLSKYRDNFTNDNYNDLATGYELNGRQIKNSIVLARALARERNTPLSLPIIRRAVTAVAGEGATIDQSKPIDGTY